MNLREMNEQQLAKAIKQNRIKIIADVFLIIVLSLIAFYIYTNIAYIKAAESMSINYCQAYLEKIGMQCFPKLIP